MNRRRFIALLGTGMTAGCLNLQPGGGSQTATPVDTAVDRNTPVSTQTESNPSTETPEETDSLDDGASWAFESDAPLTRPAGGTDTVFVGSLDQRVYAFDATTGTEEWRIGPENFQSNNYTLSAPVVAGESVYVGTDIDLLEINRQTGEVRTAMTDNPYASLTRITEDLIVGPNTDNRISAYNRLDETAVWESQIETGYGGSEVPIIGEDIIVFAAVSDYVDDPSAQRDKDSRVFGIDRETGEELWNFTPDTFIGRSAGVGYAIHENTVVIAGNEESVFGVDATSGDLRWEQSVSRAGSGSYAPQPLRYDGSIFLVTGDAYRLNPNTGDIEWSASIDAGHMSTPIPILDDKLWTPADGFFEFSSVKTVSMQGEHVATYTPPSVFEETPAISPTRMFVSHTDDVLRAYDPSAIISE